MKLIKIIVLLLVCSQSSCSNSDDDLTKEQEEQKLAEMITEIEKLASSQVCKDSTQWTFTCFGSKACGGPVGFIAYSQNIDTLLFLKKIEQHKIAQTAFNEKWGIFSDCSLPTEPKGVLCENNTPVFVY